MPHKMNNELPAELSADEAALLRDMPALSDGGQARRTFMMQTGDRRQRDPTGRNNCKADIQNVRPSVWLGPEADTGCG